MKKLWNEFYTSRLGQYLTYGIIYLIFWKIIGFELVVILCLTTILGELHFQDINNK